MKYVKSELTMLAYAAIFIAVVVAASKLAGRGGPSDAGKPYPYPPGSEFDKMRGLTAEQFIAGREGFDRAIECVEVPE